MAIPDGIATSDRWLHEQSHGIANANLHLHLQHLSQPPLNHLSTTNLNHQHIKINLRSCLHSNWNAVLLCLFVYRINTQHTTHKYKYKTNKQNNIPIGMEWRTRIAASEIVLLLVVCCDCNQPLIRLPDHRLHQQHQWNGSQFSTIFPSISNLFINGIADTIAFASECGSAYQKQCPSWFVCLYLCILITNKAKHRTDIW